jgi:hypothetical protein
MTRRRPNNEQGESKKNLIMTLFFLGVILFIGIKIGPVLFANYEFQDSIESESRYALTGYPKRSPDDIRNDIYQRSQELGLPVTKESIRLDIGQGSVAIAVDYSIPIDLLVYQFNWPFHPHADNRSIF